MCQYFLDFALWLHALWSYAASADLAPQTVLLAIWVGRGEGVLIGTLASGFQLDYTRQGSRIGAAGGPNGIQMGSIEMFFSMAL